MIGQWRPENRFMCMYSKLEELCERVDELDPNTLNLIGNRAKELNKELDEILRRLQALETINYDKNRIDFLYEVLERCLENDEHVDLILERLKSLEKIHKESPNIDGSIKTLRERQKLIDRAFGNEDAEILKTKKQFLDTMSSIQAQLKEVTML